VARETRATGVDKVRFGQGPPQTAVTPAELDELEEYIRNKGTDVDSVSAALSAAMATAAATSSEPEALNQLTRDLGLDDLIDSSAPPEEVVRSVLASGNGLLIRALVGAHTATKGQQRNQVLNRLPTYMPTLERLVLREVADATGLHRDIVVGVCLPEGFLQMLCVTGPTSLAALAPLLTVTRAQRKTTEIPLNDDLILLEKYSTYLRDISSVCVPILQHLFQLEGVPELFDAIYAQSQHCARMPAHAAAGADFIRVALRDVRSQFTAAARNKDMRSTIKHITFFSTESREAYARDHESFRISACLAAIEARGTQHAEHVDVSKRASPATQTAEGSVSKKQRKSAPKSKQQ